MSYTSAYTGAEIDAGIENAHASVLRSGSAMTGPLILHDAPTDERGAATKKYVDDAESAKAYADEKDAAALNEAKSYTDSNAETTLSESKSYTDQKVSEAKTQASAGANSALKTAKKYTDESIPTALPNPNALTFSGGASGSYDGSSSVSIEIPSIEGLASKSYVEDRLSAIDMPSTMPNPNAITFTGGTSGIYDGSSAVTVNIPSTDGLATTEYVLAQDAKILSEAEGYAYQKTQQVYDEIVNNKIPEQLPNPKALTFSGGASGTYDGSAAVNINIPGGGGFGGSEYIDGAIFETGTLTFSSISNYEQKITKPLPGALVVGNEYHITGTHNEICTAKKIVLDGVVYTAVGNLSILGVGDDTGEKFVIFVPSADKGAELGWYAKIKVQATSNGTTFRSFNLHGQYEVITRLEQKHLPADYYGEEIVDGYYLTRQTITFDESGEYQITQPLPMSLTVGDTYKIVWNGMLYSCVAAKSDTYGFPAVHVGNSSFVFIECPASMAAETGVYAVLRAYDGSTSMETSVYGPMHIIKKIDRKFIPGYGEGAGGAGGYTLVLDNSMTGGSEDDIEFYYPHSYDEIAEILYNGGNVWVDMSGTSLGENMSVIRLAANVWGYAEGILIIYAILGNIGAMVYCNNGTWTPPTKA